MNEHAPSVLPVATYQDVLDAPAAMVAEPIGGSPEDHEVRVTPLDAIGTPLAALWPD